MGTPEYFIVTLRSSDAALSIDLELPSEWQMGEMKKKILDALKSLNQENIQDWADVLLVYKDHVLGDHETLSSVGAFDGSTLYIVKKARSSDEVFEKERR